MAFSGATPWGKHVQIRPLRSDGGCRGKGTHDKLWRETAVEAREALVLVDLLDTVYRVLIQQFSDDLRPLVLHASLDPAEELE